MIFEYAYLLNQLFSLQKFKVNTNDSHYTEKAPLCLAVGASFEL